VKTTPSSKPGSPMIILAEMKLRLAPSSLRLGSSPMLSKGNAVTRAT
jgi:hypothetical protein